MKPTRMGSQASALPAALLALALAACNENPVEQSPGAAAPAEVREPAGGNPPQAAAQPGPESSPSPGKPHAPVGASLADLPPLQVGVPARVLLEVHSGIATAGIEIMIEGDAQLTVMDYSPKLLPATKAGEGHQVAVDLVPASGGTRRLTARLTLLVGGERQTRLVTLPLAVSGTVTALPAAEKPMEPPVRDASGELVRPMPAETTVRDR